MKKYVLPFLLIFSWLNFSYCSEMSDEIRSSESSESGEMSDANESSYASDSDTEANQEELDILADQCALHQAVKQGDRERVLLLLEKGMDINATAVCNWDQSEAPLHTAVRTRLIGMVKLLLDKGAKINVTDGYGCTPLYRACASNNLELVRYLFSRGGLINDLECVLAEEDEVASPFHAACRHADLDVVEFLIDCGADITAIDENGDAPLDCAAENPNPRVVEYLCRKLRIAESGMPDSWIPLHRACFYVLVEVAKILEAYGFHTNAVSHDGDTPLHRLFDPHPDAKPSDQYALAEYLLDRGARIEARNSNGDAVLHVAVAQCLDAKSAREHETDDVHKGVCGLEKILKLLWKHGADFDARNKHGKTVIDVLFEEMARRHWDLLLRYAESLIRFGFDIDEKHIKILMANNQVLHERWNKTATDEQRQKMLEHPRPIYQQWIKEEKERLLNQDLQGTYVASIPGDLQNLVLDFVVSQTPKTEKRKREADSQGDVQSNKKSKTN